MRVDSPVGPADDQQELCQLRRAPRATSELTAIERGGMSLERRLRRLLRSAHKVASDPAILLRKSLRAVRGRDAEHAEPLAAAPPVVFRHDPPLAPGDRVRVRSLEEIEATYGEDGTCGGMSFLPIVMAKYCGRTFTVRGRVDRFFDERRWKMLKVRDTVILDEVFCQPPKAAGVDWAGCERSCFLFWKEAWLERIESAPHD
jgi:hypothetical protein